MPNKNLHDAKINKNDEFYTQFEDIQNELRHYKDHFREKIVFCNCDDPTWSNFWKFFHLKFGEWGLKKLISTHYDPEKSTYKMEYTGGDDNNIEAGVMTPLMQNGDFRSPECVELMKEADIVVTNPPFSLLRAFIAQLMEYSKKFIIIGNMNAVTYKDVFPLLKNNAVWLGYSAPKAFMQPDGTIKKFGNVLWFTSLDIPKRHEPIDLVEHYTPKKYPQYDNYEAINVDKTLDIPKDYVPCWFSCPHAGKCAYAISRADKDAVALCESKCNGEMGVPISYLDKYCPEQFEIIGNGGSYRGEGSVAEELFVPTNDCSQFVHVEREREREREADAADGKSTRESSFAGCHKRNGIIGVPISFLDKYCPEQFRIIGLIAGNIKGLAGISPLYGKDGPYINGKLRYGRILIQTMQWRDGRSDFLP